MQISMHDGNYKFKSKYTQPPVIGIMTLPLDENNKHQSSNWTQITTSYIKYVESVGAIAMPIYYNHTYEEIQNLLQKINGVLFTGGGLDFFDSDTEDDSDYIRSSKFFDPYTGNYTDYTRVSSYIYQQAIEMNENGIHFPIWGT